MHGRLVQGLTHKGRKLKVTFFTDNSRDKAKAEEEGFGAVAKRFGIQLDGDAQQGGGGSGFGHVDIGGQGYSGIVLSGDGGKNKRAGAEMPPGMSSRELSDSQPVTKYPKHV